MARTLRTDQTAQDVRPVGPETELMISSPLIQFSPDSPFAKRRCIQCGNPLTISACRALTAIFRGFGEAPRDYPSSVTAFVHGYCGRPDPHELATHMLWAWQQEQAASRNEAIMSVIPTPDMPVTEISDGQQVYTLRWSEK